MKENHRPVNILSVLSKGKNPIVLSIQLFIQLSHYFEDIFNKQQFGFRKGYNSQKFS